MGVDISFSHNKNFAQNYGDDNNIDPNDPFPTLGRNNKPNNLDENRGEAMTFTFSNTLNYVKTFNLQSSVYSRIINSLRQQWVSPHQTAFNRPQNLVSFSCLIQYRNLL